MQPRQTLIPPHPQWSTYAEAWRDLHYATYFINFNQFVLKSFFDGIPDELVEAARLDGANAWRILVSIIGPLSRAALAVVTITTVMSSWKDFLWPYIVLTDPSKQPIMVGLYRNFAQQTFFPVNTELAALTIASILPIVLFLVFQRQIVRGIRPDRTYWRLSGQEILILLSYLSCDS